MAFDTGKDAADVKAAIEKAENSIEDSGAISSSTLDFQQGKTVNFRIRGADINSDATNFNFITTGQSDGDTPVNSASRLNNVFSMGWNYNSTGHEDVTQPAFRIGIEEAFKNPGNVEAFEYHLERHAADGDASGNVRIFSAYTPRSGGSGSILTMRSDIFNIGRFDNTQDVKLDFLNGNFDIISDQRIRFATNNSTILQQRNAADSAYLNVIYLDDSDAVRLGNNGKIGNDLLINPSGGGSANLSLQQTGSDLYKWQATASECRLLIGGLKAFRVFNDNGDDQLVVRNNRVAVGTVNPAFKFHVLGGTTTHLGAENSTPNSGFQENGSLAFYLNEASNELKVQVKYSDGTVKTGTVSLA